MSLESTAVFIFLLPLTSTDELLKGKVILKQSPAPVLVMIETGPFFITSSPSHQA